MERKGGVTVLFVFVQSGQQVVVPCIVVSGRSSGLGR